MSVNVHSQISGSGQPLLILHGLFGSNSNWRSISKQLAQNFEVHLLDARNHGHSPWHGEHTYPVLADDVANYISTKKLGNCIVMGHSMGGKTAMLLALAQPELVQKLVVVDISPVVYKHDGDHKQLIAAMQSIPLEDFNSRKEIEQVLGADVSDAGVRGFLLQNLVTSNGKLSWRINLEVLNNSLDQLMDFPYATPLSPYTGETLLLHGEKSHYFLSEYEIAFRSLFPNLRINTVANTGHWLHAEQPKIFLQLLSRFIID